MVDDSVPLGAWRGRIHEAADAWNAGTSAEPFLDTVGPGEVLSPLSVCTPQPFDLGFLISQLNFLGDPNVDASTGAVTKRCLSNGVTVRAIVAFDEDAGGGTGWYSGIGEPDGTTLVDVESVAAHEIGHATGWVGHWPNTATNCPAPGSGGTTARRTMCPTIPLDNTSMRSPTQADKNQYFAAYPHTH